MVGRSRGAPRNSNRRLALQPARMARGREYDAPVPFPFGRWVMIDRFPEEPVIGFVYLDPRAGPSAKGGLASETQLATMPSRTVRLTPEMTLTELSGPEVHARKLPER